MSNEGHQSLVERIERLEQLVERGLRCRCVINWHSWSFDACPIHDHTHPPPQVVEARKKRKS